MVAAAKKKVKAKKASRKAVGTRRSAVGKKRSTSRKVRGSRAAAAVHLDAQGKDVSEWGTGRVMVETDPEANRARVAALANGEALPAWVKPRWGYCWNKSDEAALAAGCYFDPALGNHPVEFIERFLRHSKGEFAGQPFVLLQWQRDAIMRAFGWRRKNGTRRFRRAFWFLPKKNGKSVFAAALSLYLLMVDGEAGAEVYSVASDRDQASIIFRECEAMVNSSPDIAKRLMVTPSTKHIAYPTGHRSYYKALSADVPTKEGLNIHGLIYDELHAQKSRAMFDTLTYGGRARKQPLFLIITTAGYDRESICYEEYRHALDVAEGRSEDWQYFGLLYEAPADMDWTDEQTWWLANPSMGHTFDVDTMRADVAAAIESPEKENTVRRYLLNQWTEQDVRWLSVLMWDRNAGLEGHSTGHSTAWLAENYQAVKKRLQGRRCYAGLDMSATQDITALTLVFPEFFQSASESGDDRGALLLSWFWVPGESAAKKEQKDQVPYSMWARQGWVKFAGTAAIDYASVRNDVIGICRDYDVRVIGVDPWQSKQLQQELVAEGLPVEEHSQGYMHMSAPTREFERLLLLGALHHFANPVLRWMAGNVVVEQDSSQNVRPSKGKSQNRIDGIVAAIMGVSLLMRNESKHQQPYEDHGVFIV